MSHKGVKGRHQVSSIRVAGRWGGYRPFFTVTLPVDMQMRTGNFLTVWVAVRRTVKIKSHQDDRLPGAVLKGSFRELYSPPSHIEHEVFPVVPSGQGDYQA